VWKNTTATCQGATKHALRIKRSGTSPVEKVLQANSEFSSKMENIHEVRGAIGLLLAEQGSEFYTFYSISAYDKT
jgi:hypothetical protein